MSTATVERHARLFRSGRNQAVRIPREFELPGQEVILRKDGECLILEPVKPPDPLSLAEMFASWETLDEEFPEIDDPPVQSENIF